LFLSHLFFCPFRLEWSPTILRVTVITKEGVILEQFFYDAVENRHNIFGLFYPIHVVVVHMSCTLLDSVVKHFKEDHIVRVSTL